MLLLVTKAMPSLERHRTPSLGRLIQPRHTSNLISTLERGWDWAADNDCYQGLNPDQYIDMLDYIYDTLVDFNDGERRAERWRGRPLFVTVPDVVADSRGTARQWRVWAQAIRRRGLPLAFAAQNGCDHPNMSPSWCEFDAVFIGGDTAWKLGRNARRIVAICKANGKHVHMGRVNSQKRLRYAQAIGVDSVDGTGYARFTDAMLPRDLRLLDRVPAPPPHPQQLRLVA